MKKYNIKELKKLAKQAAEIAERLRLAGRDDEAKKFESLYRKFKELQFI